MSSESQDGSGGSRSSLAAPDSWSRLSSREPVQDLHSSPPIELPQLQRAPRSILHHKLELEQRALVRRDVEAEMRMKLQYLGRIQEARRGGDVAAEGERRGLELGLQDRRRQLELAGRAVMRAMETDRELREEVRREEEEREALYRTLEERKQSAASTLAYIRAKIGEVETKAEELRRRRVERAERMEKVERMELAAAAAAPDLTRLPPPPPGCVQFTSLVALAGQLAELCRGEHGARLVVHRLRTGGADERALLRRELGLPASLTILLASAPCRSVLLALADTDTTTRQELLRQLKGELAAVLELEGGRTFVEEIIKD